MTDPDLSRFGRIVRERREELEIQQEEMRDHGGPSSTTMSGIERGALTPSSLTLRKLDTALHWFKGSAKATLDGGEPVPVTDLNVAERVERLFEKVASGEASLSTDEFRQVGGFLATRGRRAILDSAMRKAAETAVLMGTSLIATIDAAQSLQLTGADLRRLERIRADVDLLNRTMAPVAHVADVMDGYSKEVHRVAIELQQILARASAFNQPEAYSEVDAANEEFKVRSDETTATLTDAVQRIRRIDAQLTQTELHQEGDPLDGTDDWHNDDDGDATTSAS